MIKKLATFVEGQTEQLVLDYLLKKVAYRKNILIDPIILSGKGARRNLFELTAKSTTTGIDYYILIVNCGTDGKVISDIRDNYPGLVAQGFEKVIALRDAHPISFEDIEKLRKESLTRIPFGKLQTKLILSIMEIEAWFIAEYKHFPKIHPKITSDRIKKDLEIDVANENLSRRKNPSKDLSDIYWLENIPYDKSFKNITRILNALNHDHFRTKICSRFPDLALLYEELESFFSG